MKFDTIDSFFDSLLFWPQDAIPKDEFLRSVLWSIIAHSMRARPDEVGINLYDLFDPYDYFMDQTGYEREWTNVVVKAMWDGEFEFPFGIIAIKSGEVQAIVLRDFEYPKG